MDNTYNGSLHKRLTIISYLFNLVEYLIPKFSKLKRKEKFEILTRGIDIDNPDFFTTNIRISLAVQSFIMKTKRF